MYKICACYCLLNEEDYIKYSIDSIYNYVDKIIIVFGVAWSGLSIKKDRTRNILKEYDDRDNKFIIEDTNCKSEIEQRNKCLEIAKSFGIDYYWLIDGDEIYEKKGIELIRKKLKENLNIDCFKSFWYVYWRSVYYRIFPVTGPTPIIMRIIPSLIFRGLREPSGMKSSYVFSTVENMIYHFSYAKSPVKIKEKISTFSHSHQILPGWFENIFLKWENNREMIDIHPVYKNHFKRAIKIDFKSLPEVMKSHPFTKIDVIK